MVKRGKRVVDLTGRRFGRLVVLELVGMDRGNSKWKCVCDCGNYTYARASPLGCGDKQSCGCLGREKLKEHQVATSYGHSRPRSSTYSTWTHMKARCQNPKHERYADWGGRGIAVCERWQKFKNFLKDMGERPPGTTIERINNNRGYEPGNCKWATSEEQSFNKRPPKSVELWKGKPTGRPKGVGWSEAERALRMKPRVA